MTSIAVVGGTGPQGRGLAYRFPLKGHDVLLGSRDLAQVVSSSEDAMIAEYGLNKVRFPAPVPTGRRVRRYARQWPT